MILVLFISIYKTIRLRCRLCQDADNLGTESEDSYTGLNTTWDFLTKVKVDVLAHVYCHLNNCLLCMSVKIFLEL